MSFGIQHRAVELSLEQSGLGFTILRPTFFQQSLLLMSGDVTIREMTFSERISSRSAWRFSLDEPDTRSRPWITVSAAVAERATWTWRGFIM